MPKDSRKSTLRTPSMFINDLDLSEFIEPYTQFKKEYEKALYTVKKKDALKPYKVTFTDDKSLLYIAFETGKDKAKGTAVKYFRDNFHPDFMGTNCYKKYNSARAVVVHDLDKYVEDQKIPIPKLMEMGVTFPCTACGNDDFTLEDYNIKRCFIVEGEGDLNIFTKGIVLCYECFRKYNKNTLNT